jgi:predicted DNA-binding ribbon-helix-helix protein
VRIPEGYSNLFQPVKAVVRSERVFFTEIADVAATSLVETLIEEIKEIAHNHGLPGISDSNVESAYQAFRLLVPAEGTLSLPEIINAGWRAAHEAKLWDMYPQIADKRRVVLNELLLKSAQVLEFNLLTRTP